MTLMSDLCDKLREKLATQLHQTSLNMFKILRVTSFD